MRMNERDAIERRLPSRLWGKRGYRRLVRGVPLRISVSGIRGKSGLTRMTHDALRRRGLRVYAKVTGTDPESVTDGHVEPIARDDKRFDMVRETLWDVKRHWPMDAMVVENQAIHPDTMRAFNELLVKPHYLYVTNIRHDHLGDLARRLEVMALQFGRSAPRRTTVVCGEADARLARLVEKGAAQSGARFLPAPPPDGAPPGAEAVTMLDALLRDRFGKGLATNERQDLMDAFDRRFRWQDSRLPGIRWFHGAEINDIDSTRIVRDRLQSIERKPITYVAYFRRDRLDRTATFVPFLQDALHRSDGRAVLLCGHRASAVARRLVAHRTNVHVVPDDPADVPRVLERLRGVAAGGAILTVANAVPPWPKALAQALAPRPLPAASNEADGTDAIAGTAPQVESWSDPSSAHDPSANDDWWAPRPLVVATATGLALPGEPSLSSRPEVEEEVTLE